MHRLQKLRQAAGLTVAKLAEQTGLAEKTIREIEQGSSPFRKNHGVARILADTFECRIEDIFDEDELSHLGRPPLTGRPIRERTELSMEVIGLNGVMFKYTFTREREGIPCPTCQIIMPVTGICDDCG